MDDFDHERFKKIMEYIDSSLNKCNNRSDFLMAASYMMTCSVRIFAECFGSEDLAIAFITDYLEGPIDKGDLKKIV